MSASCWHEAGWSASEARTKKRSVLLPLDAQPSAATARAPPERRRGLEAGGGDGRGQGEGSLSILTVLSCSPSGLMRTMTDRRRRRSMPTYSDYTGTFFRREDVALDGPSAPTLGPSRRGEAPPFAAAICLASQPAPRSSPDEAVARERQPAPSQRHFWRCVLPAPAEP